MVKIKMKKSFNNNLNYNNNSIIPIHKIQFNKIKNNQKLNNMICYYDRHNNKKKKQIDE